MALDNSGSYEDDGFWDTGAAPSAPAAGGDTTAQIAAAYQAKLGRAPDATELASEIDNANRYGADWLSGQFGANLDARAASNGGGGGGGGGTFSFANGGQGDPAPPAPYGAFSFDSSQRAPGFQFKFDRAMQAVQRLGAAKGTYFNPQTTNAAQETAVGLANQDLNDEFGRQSGVYDRNFGTHQWNEDSRYGAQRNNRLDDYSMMSTDRAFNRGVLESDRGFDYTKGRDTTNDLWRFVDYGNQSSYAPR